MAERLGITRAYWSALELGNRELTGNILRALIKEFSVSADWLLTGVGADESTPDYERLINSQYLKIVWVIELTDTLGLVDFEGSQKQYLDDIVSVFKQVQKSPPSSRSINLKKLYAALDSEFDELFHWLHFRVTSKFSKEIKTFNPPRHFSNLEID